MGTLKNAAQGEGETPMECYCLFCKSGQEGFIIDLLKHSGYAAYSPLAVRNKPDAGGLRRTKARLLPGYVFLDAETEPDWETIRRYSGVLKVLRYEDGSCALRGEDIAFVNWLKRYACVIDVSQVVKVGTKIAFVGGPLVGMEAKVLKVNKSRKTVQIALGDGDALFRNIWCTIEYLEGNADLEMLHKSSD